MGLDNLSFVEARPTEVESRDAAMAVTDLPSFAAGLHIPALPAGRLQGVRLLLAARTSVVVTKLSRWRYLVALVLGILGRRKLVLIELQNAPAKRWSGVAIRLCRRWLGRSVLAAHVLSQWEIDACSDRYGIARQRIAFIPWPLASAPPLREQSRARRALRLTMELPERYVMASGRAASDWPTLFAAYERSDWDLVVVCRADERALVTRLNARCRRPASVLCELEPAVHRLLVAEAQLYVLAPRELKVSSGHVRFMEALDSGTPVVAATVRGLQDYLIDGETAVAYPPGDVHRLAGVIDDMLANPGKGERLSRKASSRFEGTSRSSYMSALRAMVEQAAKTANDHPA